MRNFTMHVDISSLWCDYGFYGNMILTCIGDVALEEPRGKIAQIMIMIIFTEGVPQYESGIGDRIWYWCVQVELVVEDTPLAR